MSKWTFRFTIWFANVTITLISSASSRCTLEKGLLLNSYLSPPQIGPKTKQGVRTCFSNWLMTYRAKIHALPNAVSKSSQFFTITPFPKLQAAFRRTKLVLRPNHYQTMLFKNRNNNFSKHIRLSFSFRALFSMYLVCWRSFSSDTYHLRD